ncbi:MAG: VWA domain-containing protein, partial [Pirellulaceae bacterium]|nr:VWA domain-containing protein [Pirellulaceae bacterium]
APLLIQWLFRKKHRETDWAATAILRAALRRRARRLRFEYWLLTALRTLLILLVVAAVAGPRLDSIGADDSAGGAHRIIVIDASTSMSYKPAGATRFDRAKELAGRIVGDSPQNAAFSLVVMGSRPRSLVAASPDRAEILRELDALEPTGETASLPPAVAEALRLVEHARDVLPGIGPQQVIFISDMQWIAWAPRLSGPRYAEFLEQSVELAKSASLIVLDVGQPHADNLAVVGARPLDPPVLAGQSTPIRVKLMNYGAGEISNQQVDLLVDGLRVARKQVDVPLNAAAELDFSYTFDAPGDYRIEAYAPGDLLEADNRRAASLSVREKIRLLSIDGRPSAERLQGAADYLETALAAAAVRPDHPRMQVETAGENALLEADLTAYDCIFLCNVARFTAAEARALNAYLQSGGGVVFFLGDRVDAENYNRQLGAPGPGGAAGANLLPARLNEIAERTQYRLDPLGFRHPILHAFSGRGEGLANAPVFKYFKLSMPVEGQAQTSGGGADSPNGDHRADDSATTAVLNVGDGDPLIVERRAGQGRVVLVATAAEPAWSALPLWPSFVPLVHEIAAFCTADRLQSQIADTAESDLARIELDELQKATWPGVPFRCKTGAADFDAATIAVARSETAPPTVLLYCALGLLIADTVLSWRFGNPFFGQYKRQ